MQVRGRSLGCWPGRQPLRSRHDTVPAHPSLSGAGRRAAPEIPTAAFHCACFALGVSASIASVRQAAAPVIEAFAPGGRRTWQAWLPPGAALACLVVGFVAWLVASTGVANRIWSVGLAVLGVPVVLNTVRQVFHGQFATDLVAMLAVVVAIVLVRPLAGLVIVLMQTGGEALDEYAEGRASAAVRALEGDAPRIAHRVRGEGDTGDSQVDDLPVDDVEVGDRLLVRPGEMVPCDGVVVYGFSHVDTSRLTGEPLTVEAWDGSALLSGSVNLEGALTIRATTVAGESQYAHIVGLVRSAQASKAPLQRLADRYAVLFTPITLIVCGLAFPPSHDWDRVLAVPVVATPCPLILATPVAIIGGVNRAARAHVVVRNGGAVEQLAAARVAIFDKIGTLTIGSPELSRWPMPIACSRMPAAASGARSTATTSVSARAPSSRRARSVPSHHLEPATREPGLRAFVVLDGRWEGYMEFADRVRDGLAAFFQQLRELGITRTMLLSGDSASHTAAVAREAGIADARRELLPGDKVAVVNELVNAGERVLTVGDGTNDAPTLAAAHVGEALAAHGGGNTAEAADVVMLADDVTRVADMIRLSRRTLRIARQGIRVGLGLSALAMVAAALGYIPPVIGAALQEALDIAVILNALRTSR